MVTRTCYIHHIPVLGEHSRVPYCFGCPGMLSILFYIVSGQSLAIPVLWGGNVSTQNPRWGWVRHLLFFLNSVLLCKCISQPTRGVQTGHNCPCMQDHARVQLSNLMWSFLPSISHCNAPAETTSLSALLTSCNPPLRTTSCSNVLALDSGDSCMTWTWTY